MVISRVSCATPLPERFTSCSETTVIVNSKFLRLPQPLLCSLAAPPARRDSRGHHHLDYFSKHELVKPPSKSLRDRTRQEREPAQASSEKHNLGKQAADRGPSKTSAAVLHHVSREPRNQRISKQESPGSTHQLSDPARTGWIKHRHAYRALSQVKSERRKAAPAAQEQPNQQHTEILHRPRHRSERQRNRD